MTDRIADLIAAVARAALAKMGADDSQSDSKVVE